MVHMSDIDWDEPGEEAMANYKKGQMVKAKVLDVDVEKERISLGIKQLRPTRSRRRWPRSRRAMSSPATSPASRTASRSRSRRHARLHPQVRAVARRSEQRPDRFAVGEKVDAKITTLDRATRKVTLSIKAREVDEEKKAMAEFGSSDSGLSLGDILGAAIRRQREAHPVFQDRQAAARPAEPLERVHRWQF
jgi:small subunit ribosomal protein S1